jgi:hypothetical protein
MKISCIVVPITPKYNLPAHLLAFARFFFDDELEINAFLVAPRNDGEKSYLEFPNVNGNNKVKLICIRSGKLYGRMLEMARIEYEKAMMQ